MTALIRVKAHTENTAKAEKVLSSGGQDTDFMTDLLLKSELVEPDAGKSRRK